jgi:serum/glucocorticoid-regulated kinase 2
MMRDPKTRLGCNGPEEIKKHPFFAMIDWKKMLQRCYVPPEPYLKMRFDQFLKLP